MISACAQCDNEKSLSQNGIKKILFIVNADKFFVSHRLGLATEAISRGFEVHIACGISDKQAFLEQLGLIVYPVDFDRGGTNPFKDIATLFTLLCIVRKCDPSIIHAITIKPVLYGGIAARLFNKPFLAAIPGLGSAYLKRGLRASLLKKIIVAAYRFALKRSRVHVVVQNASDLRFVEERVGVSVKNLHLIAGSGVDLSQIAVASEPLGKVRIVMAARLLLDKGVQEYVEAARLVTLMRSDVWFGLAGERDPGNPSSVSIEWVEKARRENIPEILGEVTNISELFASCHIVVLPSYREGFPKVLMEAAACGRAIVTTNVPGCSDAIIPGETGLLVEARDGRGLAEAIIRLIDDAKLRRHMGSAGRRLAEIEFEIKKIITKHFEVYNLLLKQNNF